MGKEWNRDTQQEAFLKQRLPEFSQAQKKKRVARFFSNFFEIWFKQYPERELLFGTDRNIDTLTEEEKEALAEAIFQRKEQLRSYFYWHSPNRHSCDGTHICSSWLVELLTGKRAKTPRQKKLLDVYSKMFYDTKIRPELEKRLKEMVPTDGGSENNNQYHPRRFSVLHPLKREMWAKEPEEVRRLVEEEQKKMAKKGEELANKLDGSNDLEELKHIELETKNLPALLDKITRAVMERTGFSMTILMRGLSHDGTLNGTVIHSGKTAEGDLTFQDTMVDFEEAVLDPWRRFLERVYPPSKRKSRADFYKMVYKIQETDKEIELGRVRTELWGFEANDENVDESERVVSEVPLSAPTDVPNEEIGSGVIRHPSSSASIVPSTTPIPKTPLPTLDALPAPIKDNPGMVEASSTPMITPVEALSNPTAIPMDPPAPLERMDNPSGLRLPSAEEISWEQGRFSSMTEELNFATGDLGFSTGMGDQNRFDSHSALLRQNSMPHGGVDMAYNGIGMNSQYWQWMNFPDATPPTASSWPAPSFPNNTPAMSNQIGDATSPPHTWPTPSFPNTTTAISNQSRIISNISAGVTSGATGNGPPSGDTESGNNSTADISSSGQGSTGVVGPSTDPVPMIRGEQQHQPEPLTDSESPEELAAPDDQQLPLQDISLNTNRRQSGRERKRKIHRDAEFEKEQEAREAKRKKGGRAVKPKSGKTG